MFCTTLSSSNWSQSWQFSYSANLARFCTGHGSRDAVGVCAHTYSRIALVGNTAQNLFRVPAVPFTYLMRIHTVTKNLFGTVCRAKTALHNNPLHRGQPYIKCASQKAMPSSVLASRSRLNSARLDFKRLSIDFVRFIPEVSPGRARLD